MPLTRASKTELLVDLLVWAGGTPTLETELLMAVLLPAKSLYVTGVLALMPPSSFAQTHTEYASTDRMGAPLLKTLSWYSSGWLSKIDQHGKLTTRTLTPSSVNFCAASMTMLTSLPVLTKVRSSPSTSCTT